ncbi:hypothetical protein BJ138DRAFT_1004176 [Hygrophoropsis aurantiaca]|uniref:Uncharacterized protein n=1 Tax=Hygrophoropsis aurantiaca TaxID=72124 RepID=A0ACB8AI39_9AGAM|nr:hypothetical protein BJ138DRAFT_1004176 [Hygrophoropsis aurantiaca]
MASTFVVKTEAHDPDIQLYQDTDDNQNLLGILDIILYPIRLVFRAFVAVVGLFRPIAPQLVPLFVCLALIPVIVFFSLFSGWYVWKSVAVGWQSLLDLQYGDGASPYAEVTLPPLSPNQPYDIFLHLTIPASEDNFALGNFMTGLTISTLTNKTLTSVRRPAIVLPPSRRFSWLTSPPRLVDVDVPLLVSHAIGVSRVIAKVEIGRRDGWRGLGRGEGRELSVVSASLRGVVKRHGIRGLVMRFPLSFALLSSITFLVISLLVLAACILPAIQWHYPSENDGDKTPASNTDRDIKIETPFRSRRKRRKLESESRSRSRSTSHKPEEISIDIPPAQPDRSLRRRPSKTTTDIFNDSEP